MLGATPNQNQISAEQYKLLMEMRSCLIRNPDVGFVPDHHLHTLGKIGEKDIDEVLKSLLDKKLISMVNFKQSCIGYLFSKSLDLSQLGKKDKPVPAIFKPLQALQTFENSLLSALSEEPASIHTLSFRFGLSEPQMKAYLSDLIERGLVTEDGKYKITAGNEASTPEKSYPLFLLIAKNWFKEYFEKNHEKEMSTKDFLKLFGLDGSPHYQTYKNRFLDILKEIKDEGIIESNKMPISSNGTTTTVLVFKWIDPNKAHEPLSLPPKPELSEEEIAIWVAKKVEKDGLPVTSLAALLNFRSKELAEKSGDNEGYAATVTAFSELFRRTAERFLQPVSWGAQAIGHVPKSKAICQEQLGIDYTYISPESARFNLSKELIKLMKTGNPSDQIIANTLSLKPKVVAELKKYLQESAT